jgi:hypothetical protein
MEEQWEYNVVTLEPMGDDDSDWESELDALGAEGWKLKGVINMGGGKARAFMMRPGIAAEDASGEDDDEDDDE